jgi:hypothetical protein
MVIPLGNSTYDLVLCRSDAGDGGWSLHAPGTTDSQIALGEGLLLSGTAARIPGDDEHDAEWDAPTQADYDKARKLMRQQP